MKAIVRIAIQLLMMACSSMAFSVVVPSRSTRTQTPSALTESTDRFLPTRSSSTALFMSDKQRSTSKKKGISTITKDRVETQAEEKKKKEEMWRVILHNDEVHTFNYVIRSIVKCIGTLDRFSLGCSCRLFFWIHYFNPRVF